MNAHAEYLIVREADNVTDYFIRLGFGVFWECSANREDAKRFKLRADAAKMMQRCGKHRLGWRVVKAL